MNVDWDTLIGGILWSLFGLGWLYKRGATRSTRPEKNSAAWEQDYPYPECFEEEQDDDL